MINPTKRTLELIEIIYEIIRSQGYLLNKTKLYDKVAKQAGLSVVMNPIGKLCNDLIDGGYIMYGKVNGWKVIKPFIVGEKKVETFEDMGW